ncbi:hypothetical protein BC830DRAFT_1156380 [Chytriomyces sp. MP71]|nr:hypothetical protein BC830DRAFT_1156380 [Chytriomyces sp. MP71]
MLAGDTVLPPTSAATAASANYQPTSTPEHERQRLKSKLTKWEKRFSEKHRRAPTKADIATVAEVAQAYLEYKRLKNLCINVASSADSVSVGAESVSLANSAQSMPESRYRPAKPVSKYAREDGSHQSVSVRTIERDPAPHPSHDGTDKNAPVALSNHLDKVSFAHSEDYASIRRKTVPKNIEITLDSDPEDLEIVSSLELRKMIAPVRTAKKPSDASGSGSNGSNFANKLNKAGVVVDVAKLKAVEEKVGKYLATNNILETSKPREKSKSKDSLFEISASKRIPPVSRKQNASSATFGDIIAPGSLALTSRIAPKAGLTSFHLSSNYLKLNPSVAEPLDDSMDISAPSAESAQKASKAEAPIPSSAAAPNGWSNNGDEMENEDDALDARKRKKPRAKRMANGLKVTKAMKVAEREIKDLSSGKVDAGKAGRAKIIGVERKRKRVTIHSDSVDEDAAGVDTCESAKPHGNETDSDQEVVISLRPARRRVKTVVSESSDDTEGFLDHANSEEYASDNTDPAKSQLPAKLASKSKTSRKSASKRTASHKKESNARPANVTAQESSAPSAKLKSDGWGKSEERSIKESNGGIGSSNFRSLKLQKSKFKKGSGGFQGKGRFGGTSSRAGGSNKSYSYRQSYGGSENPWTTSVEDAIEAIHDEAERKRLLALPDFDFERFGDWGDEDEEICSVNSQFFDEDLRSGVSVERYVDLNAALKSLTGLESFRPGQVSTIKRILNGESTILVLPTGSGKSLCYQVPAYILRKLSKKTQPCLALVVSPMVSLMQDQMRCLPPKLKGVCLSSNQSTMEYKKTMESLANDEVDILYVTPEKLQTESFQKLVLGRRVSTVRFACIDEAHCLTEWSHNFRTSYLSLANVFKEVLDVKCILGLTATATLQARKSCIEMLGLDESAVVANSRIRHNLKLTVSKVSTVENRDALLESLLRSQPFAELSSIIVYVMFQNQADTVAKYLRTRNLDADSYHAGKPSLERALIQQKFMANRLRIIVATIAFGLGINKQDVRSVIHYNMPKSIENYMQEIGRSGRDGLPALCHVFLGADDYVRHRSFAYSEGVDEASVWRFILRVFGERKGKGTLKGSGGVRVGQIERKLTMVIPVEETEKELDMKESVLATLLTYMEGFEDRPVRVFPAIYGEYSVHFNKRSALDLAETDSVVAAILRYSEKTKGKMIIDTLKVCADANVSPSVLNGTLMELKRKKEISFEGLARAFHIELPNADMSAKDAGYLDRMRALLTSKMRNLEMSRVAKLDAMYEALLKASAYSLADIMWNCDAEVEESVAVDDEEDDEEKAMREEARRRMGVLKQTVSDYFETEEGTLHKEEEEDGEGEGEAGVGKGMEADGGNLLGVKKGFRDPDLANRSDKCKKVLRIDLNDFIVQNAAVLTSGRAIARIFHGISSPKFPAYEWYKNRAWNSYAHFSFGELVKVASKLLMEFRARTGKAVGDYGNEEES